MNVSELPEEQEVFVDANVYLSNALDNRKYGEISTRFLERIEQGEIKAVYLFSSVDRARVQVTFAARCSCPFLAIAMLRRGKRCTGNTPHPSQT